MNEAQDYCPVDNVRILEAYVEAGHRPMHILKTLLFRLKRNTDGLDSTQACDALFVISSLSFTDKILIQKLVDIAANDVDEQVCNELVTGRLVSHMGRLRHFDERLLEKISNALAQDLESLVFKTFHSYAVSSAYLNYNPIDSKSHTNILNFLVSKLTSYEEVTEKIVEERRVGVWLDIVWSLSLLGFSNQNLLESVLNEDFIDKIINKSDCKNVGQIRKLLNINAIAQFIDKEYKGPTIDMAGSPLLCDNNMFSKKDSFTSVCIDIFSRFASPPNHAKVYPDTGMGFCIGAEAVIHKKSLQPMDIKRYGIFGVPTQENYTSLPDDFERLAMVPAGYLDCNHNGSFGGILDLKIRLLKSRGFKVLVIPRVEILALPFKTDKVKHVAKIFKKVMS
uniref:FAST kinase leucine-rich domain-containing protein n=2 Tax=Lepeophtheirus salmonis TaxID=72036 RepID=A0A0K2UN52_LEPSM